MVRYQPMLNSQAVATNFSIELLTNLNARYSQATLHYDWLNVWKVSVSSVSSAPEELTV